MTTEAGKRLLCTCLPLNRKLMAVLLKVDEGSVHEQGCVENAVAAERARIAEGVRDLFKRDDTARAAVLAIIEEKP